MKLWDILVDLPFSEFSFVSHEISNYYYAFIKIVMHLVNITIQWQIAWIAKLSVYQFLLYKNFTKNHPLCLDFERVTAILVWKNQKVKEKT